MHQHRFVSLALAAFFAAPIAAQAPAAIAGPDTGAVAPLFTAPGATKDGVLKAVSLADFHGKTVVLAFFYQARTKG